MKTFSTYMAEHYNFKRYPQVAPLAYDKWANKEQCLLWLEMNHPTFRAALREAMGRGIPKDDAVLLGLYICVGEGIDLRAALLGRTLNAPDGLVAAEERKVIDEEFIKLSKEGA